MAAGRIVLSQYFPARDRNGSLVPGAKLYVYNNKTTTKAPIYSNVGLTTALANPVVANASGQFPSIWASDGSLYTLSITGPTGSSIGNPSVFDDYSVSTDYDAATAAIAEAAAAAAEEYYEDILALAGEYPDPAALATRAAKNANLSDLADKAAATDNLQWKASAPALTRLLRSRVGEVVSAKDYVVGDGNADDGEAYQALINTQPAEILYPEGCEIAVTETIEWIGNQTHRFADSAKIVGDLDDAVSLGYTIQALGYPDLLPITVPAPVARGATSFTVSSSASLAPGDDIDLYDIVTEEHDINQIVGKVGTTIFTLRPINYNFATAGNIRVYKLANACRNLKIFGGEIRNVNASDAANGIAFTYSTDVYVERLVAYETGGIGMAPTLSQRMSFQNCAAIRPGRSGWGGRWIKDFHIGNFIGRDPVRDESLTFYKSCTFGTVTAPDIAQYITDQQPSGLGQAGVGILLDERCCDITITDPMVRGSRTYPIFINNQSDRNIVLNPRLSMADLGGIRIAANSNDNRVSGGWVTDVLQATDTEQGGIATAGIQDDATCSGNTLGDGTVVARIAGGVSVRQLGTAGPGGLKVRGAMVKKAADQTGANYGAAPSIAWDSEVYDTNAIHDNVTNNARLTVPAGVSFVEVGCTVALGTVGSGSIFALALKKNGSTSFNGACATSDTTTGNPDPDINIASGPIPVVAGDYFEWQLYSDDTSINIVAARSNAWIRLLD